MNKCKLSDITLQIYDGKHGGCSKQPNSGFYFISVKDIDGLVLKYENAMQIPEDEFNEIFSRTSLEVGDTLYANTGDTIGKSVFVTDGPYVSKTAFQKSVAVVKPNKEKVYPRYLYYLMKYETPRLRAAASGSGQKNLLLDTMRNFETSIHDMPDQTKIAGVLTPIDEKIKKNNVIADNLEGLVKFIYDYWFVQFDFPDQNGKPYKTSGGAMEWNDELKREIPQGWQVSNLMENSLCDVIAAGVDHFERKNYLATANVVGEAITDGDDVTFDNREGRANMQPQPYSVWFAKMKKSVKHISIPGNAVWFLDKYILSTGFEGLKCTEDSFAYIHALIYSPYFEQHKDTLAHGATQEGVNDDDLKSIKFVIPPDRELRLFAEKINPLLEQKFALLGENQTLSALRDFLLPMLMNGQVKIKAENANDGCKYLDHVNSCPEAEETPDA